MTLRDIEHLDTADAAEQIAGGTTSTVRATATATARGQFTFAGTYAGTVSYSGSYQKSSP